MTKKLINTANKKLEKICLSIITLGIYLTLFTPLIVSRSSFFPFVTPKTVYFRVIIEVIFAFYLILAIWFPRYRPKLNLLSISILLFMGVFFLTSYLGINPNRSFWSTFERMTGGFTMLHLLAFFFILTSVFKKRADWEKLLSISIMAGLLLCLHVLTGSSLSARGGGTIGNTSFMAAYLLFDFFFALILFLERKTTEGKIFPGVALAIFFPILMTSTARGAIVATFTGLFLFFLGYLFLSGEKKLVKIGILLILLLIVLGVVAFMWKASLIEEKFNILLQQMNSRFVVWTQAWQGVLERPIFGWGPENFNVVFCKFFNPCLFTRKCGGEVWFDRVHNIAFDTLIASGIVGLVSYLFMYFSAIIRLFRTYLKERENLYSFIGIAVLLIIYFFQNLLVFDMISSYVVMFLSFAFADFLVGEKENLFVGKSEDNYNTFLSKDSVLSKITKATLFILIGSGSIYLLYFGNVRAMNSATDTVEMMISEDTLEGKMESFKKALDTPMEKYEIREQFSQKIYREGFNPSQDRASLFLAFSLAEAEMEKSVKENPLDFRAHLFLGKLYSSDAQFSLDPVKLALAEKYLEKCIELSPTNQQGYWFLGEIKVTKGEKDEAFRLFEKAVELEPEFGRSHWYLAMIERIRENYAEALVEVQLAEETGYKWKSLEGIMSVVTIYQGLNDNLAIANLYQEAVILFPDDAMVWQNFASSLVNIGEIEKAKIAIMKVSEIDPSLASQTEDFLKLLEGGNLFEEVEIEI